MRERAHRDEIGSGKRVIADVAERDAARNLDLGRLSGPPRHGHRFAHLTGAHIIKKHPVYTCFQRLAKLVQVAHLDLDLGANAPRRFHRLADTARRGHVILLDEHGVPQAHAVIGAAAGGHRHFFEFSPAGRGLPRIQNLHAGAIHDMHEFPGKGGNAAEALQEIQHDALALQQQPRGA